MALRSIKYPYHRLVLSFRKGRSRLRPSWDPLQHLPPELVGAIFQHWLWVEILYQHPNPSRLPVLLSLVSKSWRHFVYTNPLLWRFIGINVTCDTIRRLAALEHWISRTQNTPLVLSLVVDSPPHLEAMQTLFASSHRFCELHLSVLDPTEWLENVSMGPFSQLTKLVVKAWPTRPGCRGLTPILSAAPLLHQIDWSAPVDPSPLVGIYGHQFLTLDLSGIGLRTDSILSILAACPQLLSANFDFIVEMDEAFLQCEIVMESLTSLTLSGSTYMPIHLLKSICAPLLHTFCITWIGDGDRALMANPLGFFLMHSSLLQVLKLHYVIHSEMALIWILRTHPHIRHLSIKVVRGSQANLLTDRTFRLLTCEEGETHRQGVLLPQLEVLSISGGLFGMHGGRNALGNRAILDFTRSRSPRTPASASPQPGLLRLVELDNCEGRVSGTTFIRESVDNHATTSNYRRLQGWIRWW